MAKKFYGIDMQGRLILQRLGSHPAAIQGTIYEYTVDGYVWACGDGSNNRKLVQEDGGTYNIDITGFADTAKYTGAAIPTESHGYVYCGYQGVYGGNMQDCDAYNNDLDIWMTRTDAPSPARRELAASTILSKGYIYGGYGVLRIQDTDEYDPTDVWASKTNTPSPARKELAASTISDKGYIYGGTDILGKLQDTDEYDPDVWASKTNMPLPARTQLAASTISDKGYVYCGYSVGVLQDTDEYTPDAWANKTDAPSPARYYLTAFTISSKGYIYGGNDGGGPTAPNTLKDTDEYTPDTWVSKTDSPLPERFALVSMTIDNKGYIYGGTSDNSVQLWDTNEYDPDTWTTKVDGPSPARRLLAASTI
jgi:hypothetical protein